MQEARQGLDEAMRDNANIEKNCKMIQGSIAAANSTDRKQCAKHPA